jgi:hypothetical protein
MSWVERPSGLIKMRVEAQAHQVESERMTLIKVENVSKEQISKIDLNHYRILCF